MSRQVPGLRQFPDRATLMTAAAGWIAERLRRQVAARGHACAALSGGTTPEPAYTLLAQERLDWPKITFALVDERLVPPEHPASNEGLLRRALAPAFAAGAGLAPMFSLAASASEAAQRADAAYAALSLDIAVMGMGPDGHTASWFPGAQGLAEALDPASPRTVVALNAPQAFGAPDRISLTRAALSRIPEILLLMTGADKRALLESALEGDERTTPIAALFADAAHAPDVYWAP